MQNQYEAPELTVVGDVDDVILGSSGFGDDFRGEILIPEDEFEGDFA